MLETHRTDLRIVDAIQSNRDGGTVSEIHKQVCNQNDAEISLDAVKRHLPGLVRLGAIRGEKAFRDERMVTIWRLAETKFSERKEQTVSGLIVSDHINEA